MKIRFFGPRWTKWVHLRCDRTFMFFSSIFFHFPIFLLTWKMCLFCSKCMSLPAWASEFNHRCFLRSWCSMEMKCPFDDEKRDCRDWVGPPTRLGESRIQVPRVERAPRLLKRSLRIGLLLLLAHQTDLPLGPTSFVSFPFSAALSWKSFTRLCAAAAFTVPLISFSIRLQQFSVCACLAIPLSNDMNPQHFAVNLNTSKSSRVVCTFLVPEHVLPSPALPCKSLSIVATCPMRSPPSILASSSFLRHGTDTPDCFGPIDQPPTLFREILLVRQSTRDASHQCSFPTFPQSHCILIIALHRLDGSLQDPLALDRSRWSSSIHSSSLSVCSMTRSSLSEPIRCPNSNDVHELQSDLTQPHDQPSACPTSRRSPWHHGAQLLSLVLLPPKMPILFLPSRTSRACGPNGSLGPVSLLQFGCDNPPLVLCPWRIVCTNCETEDASFRVQVFLAHFVGNRACAWSSFLQTLHSHAHRASCIWKCVGVTAFTNFFCTLVHDVRLDSLRRYRTRQCVQLHHKHALPLVHRNCRTSLVPVLLNILQIWLRFFPVSFVAFLWRIPCFHLRLSLPVSGDIDPHRPSSTYSQSSFLFWLAATNMENSHNSRRSRPASASSCPSRPPGKYHFKQNWHSPQVQDYCIFSEFKHHGFPLLLPLHDHQSHLTHVFCWCLVHAFTLWLPWSSTSPSGFLQSVTLQSSSTSSPHCAACCSSPASAPTADGLPHQLHLLTPSMHQNSQQLRRPHDVVTRSEQQTPIMTRKTK